MITGNADKVRNGKKNAGRTITLQGFNFFEPLLVCGI